MPRLKKAQQAGSAPRPALRPSRAPRDDGRQDAANGITRALDRRLKQGLGSTQPPASMQDAAALLQALRLTFPDELARWFPLVPVSLPSALPSSPPASRRGRDPAQALGLDLSDLRVLYRAIRVAWLAELVFGGRDEAQRWLCTPKRRLHGRVPVLLCQHGRYATLIEEWLVNIDEGNGP